MRRIFFASTVLFSVFTLILIRISTRELVPSHEQQYTMFELIKLNENSKILYDRYVLLNQQLKRFENVTEELFVSQQREKLRSAINESFWQNEITATNRGVLEAAFFNNVSISVPFAYRNNNGCSAATTTANFCLHLNFLLSFAHNRTNCSIVIAIPTVKRDSKNYLFTTLENLLMKSQPTELADTIIVISIGETDIEFILKTSNELLERFPSEIESGLIEVIAPMKQFYPNFQHLYETFNDKIDRVRWRTKQVFDFIFLMMYGYQKAPFYLQLEDDIVAKDGFISVIKEFISIKSASNPDWFYSEFCKLGFIGKLFQSSKLVDLSLFFYIFNNDKPVDWLLMDFLEVKYCSREKKKKDCDKQLKQHILNYPRSLFQHTGMESSLHGKKQKAKDRSFGKVKLNYLHQNPIANLSTNLTEYSFYTLNALYLGNNYFWAHEPKINDEIRFDFQSETGIVLKHFQFRSGNAENQKDLILQSQAVVEYLLFNQTNYQHIGTFNKYGIANYTFNSYLKSVTSLRIRFLVNFDHWIVLSEIHIEDQHL